MAINRTIIVEPIIGDDGLIQNREKARQAVEDLLGFVWAGGGIIRIVGDRVKVGELPVDGRRSEPYGETVGMVIEFDASAPLNGESITARLMDTVYGSVDPGPSPAAPVAAAIPEEPDDADEPDDEDEDDGIGGIIKEEED